MPAAKKATQRRTTEPPLPPVSTMKVEAGMDLVERMVAEHTDTFIGHGQAYKDRHREGSRRPLSFDEITQVAGAYGGSLEDPDALAQARDRRSSATSDRLNSRSGITPSQVPLGAPQDREWRQFPHAFCAVGDPRNPERRRAANGR